MQIIRVAQRQDGLNFCKKGVAGLINQHSGRGFSSQSDWEEREKWNTQFEELVDYARSNFVFQCGNQDEFNSNYGWWTRRSLERTSLQIDKSTGQPVFLTAYQILVEAMASRDFDTLRKMVEPDLFGHLLNNLDVIESQNSIPYLMNLDMRMHYKLLDLEYIKGVYIERAKNDKNALQFVKMDTDRKGVRSTLYRKKMTSDQKDYWEKMFDEANKEGSDSEADSSQSPSQMPQLSMAGQEAMSVIGITLQIKSPMFWGVQHRKLRSLCIGANPEDAIEPEVHFVRFERYKHLPLELKMKEKQLLQNAKNDPELQKSLQQEEKINPWIITDIDGFMKRGIGHHEQFTTEHVDPTETV